MPKKRRNVQRTKNNLKLFWAVTLVSILLVSLLIPGIQQRMQSFQTRAASTLVVNHTNTNINSLTQAELDAARQQDVLFNHQSVGNNILDGMSALQNQDSARYTIGRSSNPAASWYDANSGIGDFMVGSNGNPNSKIDGFDGLLRGEYGSKVKIALMKLCYVDFGSGQTAWNAYKTKMEALIRDYPNVTFIWTTAPLETTSGNAERAVFNNFVRQHVESNGGILFDIAAIESHDPSGNIIHDTSGNESLYNGYAADSGHLNSTGAQRAASAFWYLLAKSATATPVSPAITQGIQPTLWCLGGQPCTSPEPTKTTTNPTSFPITNAPTNPSGTQQPNPTLDPCLTGTTTAHSKKHRSRHKSDNHGDSDKGGSQSLFDLLMDLLRKLFALFGIEFPDEKTPNVPDGTNNPC